MGADNLAFYYMSEGFNSGADRLMGRHVAGEGFLRGYVAHAPVDELFCYTPTREEFQDFESRTADLRRGRPARWVPFASPRGLETPGALFYPGPRIGPLAWLRRHYRSQRVHSLVGVTHTIASDSAMEAIGQLVTGPVQSWDALVCTSRAVHDAVRAVLEGYGEYLAARLGASLPVPKPRLPVIPLGVDGAAFASTPERRVQGQAWRQRLGAAEGDVVVLFVGRLSFHAKADPFPMLVGLERAALATGLRVHLVQAGWFETAAVERAFREAEARFCPSVRSVHLDGRDPQVRAEIWHAADLFASLSDSIQETFGLTPVEAMAAGLPVVASDWDGYRDTVRHGTDGLLVPTVAPPPGAGLSVAYRYLLGTHEYARYVAIASQACVVDVEAATSAFATLIADPGLRRRMGAAGAERVRTRFDWRPVVAAYQELLADLAEQRRSATEDVPRGAGPAYPLLDDPYRVFAGYPTRHLSGGDLVRLRLDASEVAELRRASATRPRDSALAARIEAVVSVLADGQPHQLGELPGRLGVRNAESVFRAVGWLLKYDAAALEKAPILPDAPEVGA